MPPNPSPTARGRKAEQQAANYLTTQGFLILDRNWRNRWCEIDIVARSHPAGSANAPQIHIIEVKYRRRTTWGTGFDYITPDKVQRLHRAALAWTQAHRYSGAYQIDIISLTGELDQAIVDYLPNAVTI